VLRMTVVLVRVAIGAVAGDVHIGLNRHSGAL
jgi:hypothetical protein